VIPEMKAVERLRMIAASPCKMHQRGGNQKRETQGQTISHLW